MCSWLSPWAEGRGPYERGERRGRGTRKRDRQVGPREEPAAAMVTVAFPPRLVAMETPRGPFSFTFAYPLSVFFVLPDSTSLSPNRRFLPVLTPGISYTISVIPSLQVSPRRVAPTRQASLYLWHSLIFSPFLRTKRKRGPEIKRNAIGREKREAAVFAGACAILLSSTTSLDVFRLESFD